MIIVIKERVIVVYNNKQTVFNEEEFELLKQEDLRYYEYNILGCIPTLNSMCEKVIKFEYIVEFKRIITS